MSRADLERPLAGVLSRMLLVGWLTIGLAGALLFANSPNWRVLRQLSVDLPHGAQLILGREALAARDAANAQSPLDAPA